MTRRTCDDGSAPNLGYNSATLESHSLALTLTSCDIQQPEHPLCHSATKAPLCHSATKASLCIAALGSSAPSSPLPKLSGFPCRRPSARPRNCTERSPGARLMGGTRLGSPLPGPLRASPCCGRRLWPLACPALCSASLEPPSGTYASRLQRGRSGSRPPEWSTRHHTGGAMHEALGGRCTWRCRQ